MNRLTRTLFPVALALSCSALAQSAPADQRFGVMLGGIPPFFVSVGGYATVADFGDTHLEAQGLASLGVVPTFGSGLGAEADLLLSYALPNTWRVYGGAAAALAHVQPSAKSTYYGLGALAGIRGGNGFGLFAEVGAVTFFDAVSGPFARLGVKYSF